MEKISTGVDDYNKLGGPGRLYGGDGAPGTKNDVLKLLEQHWKKRSKAVDQFNLDARMWYGAIQSPGNAALRPFLKKLFAIFMNAGVFGNAQKSSSGRPHMWQDFWRIGLPLASILGHGGRVIIQLPIRTETDNSARRFFDWLTAEIKQADLLFSRSAATHALDHNETAIPIHGYRKMRLSEKRGKLTGIRAAILGATTRKEEEFHNHFGVNVALGGAGNRNPFSGNTIASDGCHGHMYIYFNQKSPGKCGGLMIGCENSAPHAMSQTFVMHDWRAISEPYSPCGTQKWPKVEGIGPKSKAEAMFVDLSDGWEWLMGMEDVFQPEWLDYSPMRVPAAARDPQSVRNVLYALWDVMALPHLSRSDKNKFAGYFDTLLKRGDPLSPVTDTTLEKIWDDCERIVKGSGKGAKPQTRKGPTQMPESMQEMQMACSRSHSRGLGTRARH